MATFGAQVQALAPLFLGIGSQANGDPAGIARGMALMQAKQERDQRKAAIDNMMAGMGISGQKKSFLASLPVEAQQQFILQQMAPKPRNTQVINGKVVDMDTMQVLGDFSDPVAPVPSLSDMGMGGGGGGGLDPYLVGGGTRPDAITGLDGAFRSSVERMIADAPPEIRDQFRITSAYRSDEVQEGLFAAAVQKYGSEDAARKWVAPPGRSRHNHGGAIDFKYLGPDAKKWAHENAAKYGLHFPMEHEPWHVEPIGSRAPQAAGAQQPAQAPAKLASLDEAIKFVQQYEKFAGAGYNVKRYEPQYNRMKGLIAQNEKDHLAALRARAEAGGLEEGSPEWQQFMLNNGAGGTAFTVSPDGTVSYGTGAAAANVKFNETESKTNTYAVRAKGALDALDSVGAEKLTSRTNRVLDAVPGGIGRELQSEDFQVAQQAGDEFLQAILRKDTGAAITTGEQAMYGDTYLPRPGDGPRVVEAKRKARIRAIAALESGMSAAQQAATDRAIISAEVRAEGGSEGSRPDQTVQLLGSDQGLFEKYGVPTE